MVNQNLRWETFDDPLMHQGVQRSYSLFWVPFQTSTDEIMERITLTHQYLIQRLRGWDSQSTLRILLLVWLICFWVKEDILPCSLIKDLLVWEPNNFHDK